MSKDALRAELMTAIASETKPVTAARALEVATTVIDGADLRSFEKWLEVNGAAFLRRVNA